MSADTLYRLDFSFNITHNSRYIKKNYVLPFFVIYIFLLRLIISADMYYKILYFIIIIIYD